MTILNTLGYGATVLTASSFLMKEVKHLRLVNGIGCVAWIVYGSMLESTPIIVTNALILGINLYRLRK